VRFYLFLITVEVVTAHKEEVEGAETHEMHTLGHRTSAGSVARSVSTGRDINDEAQSAVSQVEGVASIWPCCLIPRQLFRSVTGSGERDVSEINIDQSRSRDEVSGTTSDRLTQADAHTCAYLLTIVEISMT